MPGDVIEIVEPLNQVLVVERDRPCHSEACTADLHRAVAWSDAHFGEAGVVRSLPVGPNSCRSAPITEVGRIGPLPAGFRGSFAAG
jgi:hypothetical protein